MTTKHQACKIIELYYANRTLTLSKINESVEFLRLTLGMWYIFANEIMKVRALLRMSECAIFNHSPVATAGFYTHPVNATELDPYHRPIQFSYRLFCAGQLPRVKLLCAGQFKVENGKNKKTEHAQSAN